MTSSKASHYDVIVIGGGFYGCLIAAGLAQRGRRVALVDQESEIMQRASYTNQARIHQGYHYPRSILTALRSRVNFDRFIEQFEACVYDRFDKYYAIAANGSKVNADQFRLLWRIGAPIDKAPSEIRRLLNPNLIEEVFRVREYAFDTTRLKGIMRQVLEQSGVDIHLDTVVAAVTQDGSLLRLDVTRGHEAQALLARRTYNCTYSGINQLLARSGLDVIPLKHELTEMALLDMPLGLENTAFTVMDGPFFWIMPFPARGRHILSHVRYTPHFWWQEVVPADVADTHGFISGQQYIGDVRARSHGQHMLRDAARYMPVLKECRLSESIWEIKTVLPQSEIDDSRPILFRPDRRVPQLISIMGGKIDNIFDVQERISEVEFSQGVAS